MLQDKTTLDDIIKDTFVEFEIELLRNFAFLKQTSPKTSALKMWYKLLSPKRKCAKIELKIYAYTSQWKIEKSHKRTNHREETVQVYLQTTNLWKKDSKAYRLVV